MHLAVIIPALNEEATIKSVIEKIAKVDFPKEVSQTTVVVIDDGSTDKTSQLAQQVGALVVRHTKNRGAGAAFKTGLDQALTLNVDLVCFIDADGQFNPHDIPKLLQPILDDNADFVTASRFKDRSLTPDMPGIKLWGNRQMSRLISLIVGKKFYDVSCGFRAYNRDAALRLNLWGEFTYTQESFLDLSAKGIRILEVPTKVRGVREIGESRVANNLWVYFEKTIVIILHAFRDFWPMRFFGFMALLTSIPGIGLLIFLFHYYLQNGSFFPHTWAGFVGGSFLLLSLVSFITGIVASMLKRIRLNQEEILFHLKTERYRKLREEKEKKTLAAKEKEICTAVS